MTRAVFLDRDGVINRVTLRQRKPYPPESVAELEFLPGIGDALTSLVAARYCLIVVTNQPDVGAGRQRREVVEAMHDRIRRELPVSDIRVCYHQDQDRCNCRKPKPGMLIAAARDRGIALAQSFMIGDRWRDIEAGRAVGCRTILVRADYDERQAERPDAIVTSLLEASRLIVSGRLG